MRSSIKQALVMSVLAISGSVSGINPAGASSPSVGTSEGSFNDYGQADVGLAGPQCIENTTDAVLTIENTEVSGSLGDTTATVTIAAGDLHFNPAGTFIDDQCLIPGPVPAMLTVGGCSPAVTASYGREGEAAEVISTNSCMGHVWEFEASQQPCVPGAPFDPCPITGEWVGTYQAI